MMRPFSRAGRLRTRRSRRGMSILEMMIAVTVLLFMSIIVYQSLSSSVEFNELLAKRDGTTRSARATLSKLRRELQLAYLTPSRQAIETVETVFVGQDDNPDQLYFASLAHQRLYMDSRECDQTEITVFTESAPRDMGKGYILYHREAPRVDDEPGESGKVYPLAYNVRSFNVRYLDPQTNEYRDEWDTRDTDTLYRLPRAIEIGLVLIAPSAEDDERTVDVPFLSRFQLVYAQRLMPNYLSLGQVSTGTDGTAAPPTNNSPLPYLGGGTRPGGLGAGASSGKNNRNRTPRKTASGVNARSPRGLVETAKAQQR